ncbi:MAG: hypothetical protein RQ736_01325 [Thiogranum sp.]|nr:hypothetical protein [Thiogranum sp.]
MSHISFSKTAVACALGLVFSANAANAATCASIGLDVEDMCLENGNSVFVVNPQDGVSALNVDGTKHIFLQDFYYDDVTGGDDSKDFRGMLAGTGGYGDFYTSAKTEVDGVVSSSQTGSTSLSFFYEPSTKGQQASLPLVRLDFELVGSANGSDTATIIETFTIINRQNVAMDVSMFAYTDIDLAGPLNSFDDQAELVDDTLTRYRQFDANFQMLATTDVAVDGYKIGIGDTTGFGGTVLDLFGSGMGNLQLGTADPGPWLDEDAGLFEDTGPGADLQMAAQWNRQLAANGGSFSYTHTLSVSPAGTGEVPVPAALPLALSGLALLGMAGRRKRKMAASSQDV